MDARVASRYTRANVHGSDRYTPNFAGTSQYRLPPGDSGFSNLTLAGDWTDNGLNCGCIEAAVMSGLQAARALGAPLADIPGETDEWLQRLTHDLSPPAPLARASGE